MLAIYGPFVFGIKTAPFQTFKRQVGWNWVSNKRLGKRAAHQFAGQGDDVITLTGVLMPEITGGRFNLDLLRALGDEGLAWPLIDGEGMIYGLYFLTDIQETRTELMQHGEARKIEFTLTLKRYDDTDIDKIGALTRVGLGLV